MSLDKNNSEYSKIAKLFHWGFVLLFVYGVLKQVDNINQLKILLANKTTEMLHGKQAANESEKTAKEVFSENSSGHSLPSINLNSKDFEDNINIIDFVIIIHELNINLLYWFIGIHILAATYHRSKRDGVWSSMAPFFKEKKPK